MTRSINAAAGAELEDQGIQRDTLEHDRDERLAVPRVSTSSTARDTLAGQAP